MSLRSKWAAGWGSVSAGRRIGVWGNKTAFRHGYIDQEVSATADEQIAYLSDQTKNVDHLIVIVLLKKRVRS